MENFLKHSHISSLKVTNPSLLEEQSSKTTQYMLVLVIFFKKMIP